METRSTARAMAPTACSIESLPDNLLGHIMLLVDAEHRRSLLLVSRRWRRAYLSEPGLCVNLTSYTVQANRADETPTEREQRLVQQAALLKCVARHVVTFHWDEFTDVLEPPADVVLERCLSALRSGQLAKLQLSGPCPSAGLAAAGAALLQLSSVTSLVLSDCSAVPAAVALYVLGSRLCSLQLGTGRLAPAILERISQAAQLTALSIESYAWPALGALTLLSQLKQLVLLDLRADFQDSMQPPPPASFPAGLERFSFETENGSFEVAGCQLFKLRVWQGTAPRFGFFDWEKYNVAPPTLAIGCRSPSLPLAELLSVLQPAGAQPLAFQRLELSDTLPDAAAVAGWSQLGQLRQLCLTGLQEPDDSTVEQAVAALLQQAGRLADLELEGLLFFGDEMRLPMGLTRLYVDSDGWHDMPRQFAQLTQLQRLKLATCEYSPDSLSQLSALSGSLTRLELVEMEGPGDGFAALTRLQHFACCLEHESAGEVMAALLPNLTALTCLTVWGDVAMDPLLPALSGLSRLQLCDLEDSRECERGRLDAQPLPGGPWLESLRWLSASTDSLVRSASVLQAATALQSLSMYYFAVCWDTPHAAAFFDWLASHRPLRRLSLQRLSGFSVEPELLLRLVRLCRCRLDLQVQRPGYGPQGETLHDFVCRTDPF